MLSQLVPVLVGYWAFTWLTLRATLNTHVRSRTVFGLLAILGFAQFSLKLVDRYYLPSFDSRAGDEIMWRQVIDTYETGGSDPLLWAQGPGIFWITRFLSSIFREDTSTSLALGALVFGSLTVFAAFFMYRHFIGDDGVALAATVLVSMSDVMIYSTTIARPTLYGFLLLPVALILFGRLRTQGRPKDFFLLIVVSAVILLMHAPVTYVVLLAVVASTMVLYGHASKYLSAYTVTVFALYGVSLRFLLPVAGELWRVILVEFSLGFVPAYLGTYFFLIFPLAGIFIVAVCMVSPSEGILIVIRDAVRRRHRLARVLLVAVLAGGFVLVSVILAKYTGYIGEHYGSAVEFGVLHGWKLAFILLALEGIRRRVLLGIRPAIIPLAWLASLAMIVAVLATYPAGGNPVFWNTDERFAEFAYYPAFYFAAIGLSSISNRLHSGIFRLVLLPALSAFVVPAIIVGTHATL